MFSLKSAVCRGISAPSARLPSQARTLAAANAAIKLNGQTPVVAFQRRWLGESAGGYGGRNGPFDGQGGFAPQPGGGRYQQAPEGHIRSTFGGNERTGAPIPDADSINRPAPTPKRTVYVGNLFFSVTAEDLEKEFSKFGKVETARIVYDNRGMSRGFGYVRYDNVDEARKAIGEMHLQLFEGRRLAMNFARSDFSPGDSQPKSSPTRTIYIGNIPFEMTDKELNDLFKDMDNLIDVRVAVDRRTGQPRGFCHAEFVDVKSCRLARNALETMKPYGRQLRMDYSNSAPGRLQQYLAQKGIDPATFVDEEAEAAAELKRQQSGESGSAPSTESGSGPSTESGSQSPT